MYLKEIAKVSFRNSEETNYNLITRRGKFKLKGDEVLVLISLSGDQIQFVWQKNGDVIRSQKLRRREKWTIQALGDYARSEGIKLSNFKLLDEWYGKKINTQKGR